MQHLLFTLGGPDDFLLKTKTSLVAGAQEEGGWEVKLEVRKGSRTPLSGDWILTRGNWKALQSFY